MLLSKIIRSFFWWLANRRLSYMSLCTNFRRNKKIRDNSLLLYETSTNLRDSKITIPIYLSLEEAYNLILRCSTNETDNPRITSVIFCPRPGKVTKPDIFSCNRIDSCCIGCTDRGPHYRIIRNIDMSTRHYRLRIYNDVS